MLGGIRCPRPPPLGPARDTAANNADKEPAPVYSFRMHSKRPLPGMIPFDSRFPQTAARETRSLHVVGTGGPLPPGEYGYLEFYCDEPACDCRRVLLQVKFGLF